jgi:hypothetical protein
LYGVDKNIMAVDLAKLSLWLVTLAKDHPFTFLDHSLRHGDSLVGLTREQIIRFDWEPKKQMRLGEDLIQKRLDRATEARAKILNAREDAAYRDQEERMALANESLNLIRLLGDACVSCFFTADKKKAREQELERVYGLASSYFSSLTTTVNYESRFALQAAADRLKAGSHPVPCFHWEIEFPEVFSRDNAGFDGFVGNPPFLGGKRISGAMGTRMKEWLAVLHHDSSGNADLVSHFFRRAFIYARSQGTIGLIATNTIAQGDTRRSGLRWICHQGGEIYSAVRRFNWPGVAAVVVSVIHIEKGEPSIKRILDGKAVSFISAFLFHQGSHDDPKVLKANNGLSFVGCDIKGQGFLFDDTDSNANPVSLMHELVREDASNQDVIKPYLGGSELNTSPTLSPSRWVIHFGERSLEEAKRWTKLIAIVEENVKAERAMKSGGLAEWPWWQFWRVRRELYEACIGKERVIACAQTSRALAFSFLSPEIVFSHKTIVLTFDDFARYGVLQSRVHVEWAYFFGSTMKDDPVYTPSDCFDTFPFPQPITTEIATVAEQYYTARNQIMRSRDLGITDTLNLFDNQRCIDEDILKLRSLHGEMDITVLRAYGWNDLADQAAQPNFCEFLLDYEEDEDDTASDSSGTRQKKKPWRYRWPDDFRDEVLARLLELNEQRYKEEMLLVKGKSIEAKPKEKPSKKQGKNKATPLLDGLDQVEISRDERLLLLVVDAFKLITRAAMDEAFIAMKYLKLRKSRLGLGDPPKSVPRTDPGRDALIGGLVDRGYLEKHPSDHQQIWKLGANAPSPAATSAERQALEETKAIFQKSIDSGDNLASCNQGVTDAKPGLVSTLA